MHQIMYIYRMSLFYHKVFFIFQSKTSYLVIIIKNIIHLCAIILYEYYILKILKNTNYSIQ